MAKKEVDVLQRRLNDAERLIEAQRGHLATERMRVSELRAIIAAQEWRSATTEPPERTGNYLIFFLNGEPHGEASVSHYDAEAKKWRVNFGVPVVWRSLPAGPASHF